MHSLFGTVIWIVCGVGLVGAVVGLIMSGRTWEEWASNRLQLDSDLGRAGGGGSRPMSAASLAERDMEIRQMIEARNARALRRGEAPVDVEAELARLTAPAIDAGLQAEIRDLVIARNYRRTRAGKPPLDVEAEVARQIAELSRL